MVYINLKELRDLRSTGLSLTKIAKHYGVDLFHLNNFIWSHKNRNGTYPVDGTRNRSPVNTRYVYPDNKTLANKLKTKSIRFLSEEFNIPYETLRSHINRLGLKVKVPNKSYSEEMESINPDGVKISPRGGKEEYNLLFDKLK